MFRIRLSMFQVSLWVYLTNLLWVIAILSALGGATIGKAFALFVAITVPGIFLLILLFTFQKQIAVNWVNSLLRINPVVLEQALENVAEWAICKIAAEILAVEHLNPHRAIELRRELKKQVAYAKILRLLPEDQPWEEFFVKAKGVKCTEELAPDPLDG